MSLFGNGTKIADPQVKVLSHAATFVITLAVLGLLGYVTYWVMLNGTEGLKNIIVQAIVMLATVAVGFWVGASKTGADNAQAMQQIAGQSPAPIAPTAPTAPTAAVAATAQVAATAEVAAVAAEPKP